MPRRPLSPLSRLLGCLAIALGCAAKTGPGPDAGPPSAQPRPTTSQAPASPPTSSTTAETGSDQGSSADPRQAPPREEPAGPAEPAAVAGITAAHNRARAELGVPALTWSSELAAVAEDWARRLAADGCGLQHRSDGRYGENLYAVYGTSASPQEVVDSWVSEAADYNYKKNRCKGVCGHYTQVVWRASQRLGCASARCSEGEVWVCNYDPPGNFVGERPY